MKIIIRFRKVKVLDIYRMYRIQNITVFRIAAFFLWCNFLLSFSCYAESIEALKDFDAIQRVLVREEKVANAAWWGFDTTDATKAIQGAINSGASKVIIPYVGRDWIVQPIKLANNQEIVFEPGVVVIAKKGSFKGENDCLFSAVDKSNITLRGYNAVLRMRKEDYESYKIKSEHRHVLEIRCSENITVLGLRLENAGGDGIYIGAKDDKRDVPCKNILIRDCICDNNYRQGISVTSVDKLRIENCVLSNTKGTAPQAGIDIEPSHPANMLVDVVVSNCIAEYNGGSGFFINISRLTEKSREISVLFVNCYARKSAAPGLRARSDVAKFKPKGLIEFRNCTSEDISYSGIGAIWESTSDIKLRFNNCKLKTVAKKRNQIPIHIKMRRNKKLNQLGGIEFTDCYIYDEKNRPFLAVSGFDGDEGVYNIRGNINVYNNYGARIDLGTTSKKLALKVNSFKTRK